MKLTHVKKLPLVIASQDEQAKISELVKQILSAKKHDPEANIAPLESAINVHVERLYGMTKNETIEPGAQATASSGVM